MVIFLFIDATSNIIQIACSVDKSLSFEQGFLNIHWKV